MDRSTPTRPIHPYATTPANVTPTSRQHSTTPNVPPPATSQTQKVMHPMIYKASAVSSKPKIAPQAFKNGPEDMLNLIHGPAIVIAVGPGPGLRRYTLPATLVNYHSIFLRKEIVRIVNHVYRVNVTTPTTSNENNGANNDNPKKRRLTSSPTSTPISIANSPPPASKPAISYPTISLLDINPTIFGLFLRYMYQGAYASTVDATYISGAAVLTRTSSAPAINGTATPISLPDEPVPPSISAYLLATDLLAVHFLNHTMLHIYQSVGEHFSLTPSLVDYVWKCTAQPATNTITPQMYPPTLAHTNAPLNIAPLHTKSPLRTLILHILVTHWAAPSRHVAKFPGMNAAWDAVFNAHADLRSEFLFGLQGREYILGVQSYLVQKFGGVGTVEEEKVVEDEAVKGEGGEKKSPEKGGDSGGADTEKTVVKVE